MRNSIKQSEYDVIYNDFFAVNLDGILKVFSRSFQALV